MKKIMQKFNKNKKHSLMLFALIFSFGLYSYAIVGATTSVSSTKMMNQDLQELQTDIAELELSFFELIDDLTPETALAYGLSETQDVQYVERDGQTTVALR